MANENELQQWLDHELDKIQSRIVQSFDEAVIAYFGSVEEAYRQRDSYVIEAHPPELSYSPVLDVKGPISLKIETTYRIRPRRLDE